LAWLLGLILPGAPGGLGVFEATALALLDNTFSSGLILSSVAVYRVISILAEAGGAGLAVLDERWRG
jgi:glycosyltransferase 2 family protein